MHAAAGNRPSPRVAEGAGDVDGVSREHRGVGKEEVDARHAGGLDAELRIDVSQLSSELQSSLTACDSLANQLAALTESRDALQARIDATAAKEAKAAKDLEDYLDDLADAQEDLADDLADGPAFERRALR